MVPHDVRTAVVVSELFPPAVGGSAVLLGNVYGRFTSAPVVVLSDLRRTGGADPGPGATYRLVHQAISGRLRGLVARGALRQHIGLARAIRSACRPHAAVVHTARAMPEGVGALGHYLGSKTPYVCWCHGEEVATALTSRELSFVMRRVYGKAAAIIANSTHTRDLLVRRLALAAARIHVVTPGVDTQRFQPDVPGRRAMRERLARGDGPLLLSVGRLQRRKGHDLALQAVARLVLDHPTLRYAIIGDGEERGRLEALVTSLGIGSHVLFVGELPDADLPAAYAASDIFVLPNRVDGADVEGFGIVFLEAAAAGLPVIGGRSGGVPEAIEEGATGLLVSGTDADELAGQVRTLAASCELRTAFGERGRARAVRAFTWDRAAAAVQDIHMRTGNAC